MQYPMSEDTIILIRMVEAQRRTIQRAQDDGEPREVLDALTFLLRETQAELADDLCEFYRESKTDCKS